MSVSRLKLIKAVNISFWLTFVGFYSTDLRSVSSSLENLA